MSANLKKYLFITGTFTVCLVLVSIIVISLLRERNFKRIYEDVVTPYNAKDAEIWLNAVKNSDPRKAIQIAGKIVLKQVPYVPDVRYLDVTQSAQISSNFFNPPFSILDFEYWRDMYTMRKVVTDLRYNPENLILIKKIFNAVNERIKIFNYKKDEERPAFFKDIWIQKKGDLIDKYLLFSVLTEQAGFNTQIALIYEEYKKNPMRIVAETIKNGQHYTCDFSTNTFWTKPLSEVLKKNSSQLKKIWKNKWSDGPKLIMYKAEFSASNYKKANQLLGKFLNNYKNEDMPIIGSDPNQSQKVFMNQITNKDDCAFTLGIETFLMVKNSNLFLKQWHMKELKK